ncbi:UNVERIFIED_CONTAM: hypothetical protein LBW93_01190 [Wolbachia endosymbiont of Nasonia longicornis]
MLKHNIFDDHEKTGCQCLGTGMTSSFLSDTYEISAFFLVIPVLDTGIQPLLTNKNLA